MYQLLTVFDIDMEFDAVLGNPQRKRGTHDTSTIPRSFLALLHILNSYFGFD
jgi:hypothetical protein